MSSANQLAVLAIEQRNQLESLLMEFDQAWTGELLGVYQARLESDTNENYRRLTIVELVKIDLQRTWSSGQGRLLENYCEQIADLGDADSIDPDLILVEYAARRSVDADLDLQGYASRFPKQFDELSQRASEFLESNLASKPAQGSIETSRVNDIHDTNVEPAARQSTLPKEFGRYRILRELGAGAMGQVYLAHDTQLDRQVALKTPSFSGGKDAEMVTRFYREARAAAKIQHRSICPIYDVGEIDSQHFISMGYIKGRCMSEYIRPDKLPPQKTSAILIHRLALALAEAHHHNVIHRDLKPANIMIDKKREPVVMDFGLARQTDVESRMTASGMIVGTPAYMSPEQMSGDPADVTTAVDVYALGVILYELLTGTLPFRGGIAQVVHQITHKEPTPPSEIRPEIDAELEAICAKMMAKDRAERFQSMDDVAAALKKHLKGKGKIKALGEPPTDTAPKEATEGSSETGALNAFFAAQGEIDRLQTLVEPSSSKMPAVQIQQPQAKSSRGPLDGTRKLIAAGLAGALILLLGIVFLVRTPHGTIRIETTGDLSGLEVLVDGNMISLEESKGVEALTHEFALELDGSQLKFDPKTSQFIVIQNDTERRLSVTIGNLKLSSTSFTVTENQETVLRIELLPLPQDVASGVIASNPSTPPSEFPLGSTPDPERGSAPPLGTGGLPVMQVTGQVSLKLSRIFERVMVSYKHRSALAISRDGRWLVHSITPDKKLERFDLATGEVAPLPFESPKDVRCAAFSEDGSQIVMGTSGGFVIIRDTTNRKKFVTLKSAERLVSQVAFAGDYVVAWSVHKTQFIQRWHRNGWDLSDSFERTPYISNYTRYIDVADDGERIVIPSTKKNAPEFWSLSKGEQLPITFGTSQRDARLFTLGVSLSPDGQSLLSWGYSGGIVVWDAKSGKALLPPIHSGGLGTSRLGLARAVFSRNGKWIVASRSASLTGSVGTPGRLVIHDVRTGDPLAQAEIPNRPKMAGYMATWAKMIVMSDDGRTIVTAGQSTPICVWKVEEAKNETLEPASDTASVGDASARSNSTYPSEVNSPAAGYTLLLNSNNLDLFTQRGGKAKFELKDGVLVGTSVPDTNNSFLCTKRDYADFVLEYEYQVDPPLNSGVQIRSLSTPDYKAGRVHGYQVEIDGGRETFRNAAIYDEAGRGWLDQLKNNEPAHQAFKPGQWNKVRVVCDGDSIKTWLNGVPAADLRDDATASGFIAFQVHGLRKGTPSIGKQVRWRNVRIKELPTASTGVLNPKGANAKTPWNKGVAASLQPLTTSVAQAGIEEALRRRSGMPSSCSRCRQTSGLLHDTTPKHRSTPNS